MAYANGANGFPEAYAVKNLNRDSSSSFVITLLHCRTQIFMADKAHINPKVLQWARETARFSVEDAAKKVTVQPERLIAWEQGEALPTIRQAETLAKAYRRPFALFFFPDIPRDFQPLTDFRRRDAQPLGTASTFIIREIQQKQAWTHELYTENNEPVLAFVGRFMLSDSPERVAENMLRELGIRPARYTATTPIREWINKAEGKGIFISRTSFIHSRLTLDSEELQGFAIADRLAPFVFINSNDWDAPQLFTLVHELAHIWIAASGISSDVEPKVKSRDQLHPVELFCNQVAASALMPADMMQALPARTFDRYDHVFGIARRLGVSSFALLYRTYTLDLISSATYRHLKADADEAFERYVQEQERKKALQRAGKKSGPDHFMLLVNKNSPLFTRVVLDAFRGGAIAPTEASNLLNTQVNNFPKLEAFL